MKQTGIFYGSTTGTTAAMAQRIAQLLNIESKDIYNVAGTSPDRLGDYDVLILGTSTLGSGDLQDDWYDFVAGAEALDLKGKKIALFGCGDETMSDTFCDAVGTLYERLKGTGAEFIAPYDTVGYRFEHSRSVHGEKAVGLLLDEVNHPEMSDIRIRGWITLIKDTIN